MAIGINFTSSSYSCLLAVASSADTDRAAGAGLTGPSHGVWSGRHVRVGLVVVVVGPLGVDLGSVVVSGVGLVVAVLVERYIAAEALPTHGETGAGSTAQLSSVAEAAERASQRAAPAEAAAEAAETSGSSEETVTTASASREHTSETSESTGDSAQSAPASVVGGPSVESEHTQQTEQQAVVLVLVFSPDTSTAKEAAQPAIKRAIIVNLEDII